MKLPFNPSNRKTQAIVAAFVLGLLAVLAFCSQKAEAGEIRAEAGSAIVRGYTPTLGLSAYYTDAGPADTDVEAGVLLVGESTFKDQRQSNTATVYGMLWANAGPKFQLGLGVAYTQGDQTYTCKGTFALGVRYQPTRRVALTGRHFSSADTCKPNTGRDTLGVGFTVAF